MYVFSPYRYSRQRPTFRYWRTIVIAKMSKATNRPPMMT